jgi:hypothetical protein
VRIRGRCEPSIDHAKSHAPNITPGPGNVVARYSADDWVRTLRHGVKLNGRPAIVMPSED